MKNAGIVGILPFLITIEFTSAIITNGIYRPINQQIVPPFTGGIGNQVVPCGSSLEVVSGVTYTITSPGYPGAYPAFSTCQWSFYSRTSSSVTLSCQAFQLAPSTECSNNAFLVIDPGNQQFQWYCGNNGPQNVVSNGNYISLLFWASWQNSNNYQGFTCTVQTNALAPNPVGGNCRCGQRQPRNRIVGGDEASVHEFPWLAVVYTVLPVNNRPGRLCGGSLINEKFVLTAAHCIDKDALPNGALPTVFLGEHNRKTNDETTFTIEVRASAVWPHEKYNTFQGISIKDFDIGLVELERPVSLTATPNIAPACAPNPIKSYDNVPAIVAGWGYTSYPTGQQSDVLMRAELRTVPISNCKNNYDPGIITNKMICAFAQGKDACFDDSGAPLMAKEGDSWVIIGIVSFGPDSCAHPTISGVYTRVGDYIHWIVDKIGNARTCPP